MLLVALVVQILEVQSFFFTFLCLPSTAFALFVLLSQVVLPRVYVLRQRLIAGNELFPSVPSLRAIVTVSVKATTTTTFATTTELRLIEMLTLLVPQIVGSHGPVRTTTDRYRLNPRIKHALLLEQGVGTNSNFLAHKHKQG